MSRENGYRYCPNWPRVLIKTDQNGTKMMRARCKRWGCPYCGAKNAKIWQYRIIRHIQQSNAQWSLLTITPHPSTLGPVHSPLPSAERDRLSLENLRTGWGKMRKRIWREYGRHDYVRVFERFKRGGFHMHLMVAVRPPDIITDDDAFSWCASPHIIRHAIECGLGERVDIRPVQKGSYAPYYVTKYLSKDIIHNAENIGTLRRVQTSQGWHPAPNSGQTDGWEVASGLTKARLMLAGGRVHDLDEKRHVTSVDFPDGTYVYAPTPPTPVVHAPDLPDMPEC